MLDSFSVQLLSWGFLAHEWWRNYLHVHSFFEVCYAFEGSGTFRIAGVDYTVNAGDVFVAPPNIAHEIISATAQPLGIYFWAYTLAETDRMQPADSELNRLMTAFLTSNERVSARTEAMQRTIDLIVEEIVLQPLGYAESISALMQKLVLDTARAVTDLPHEIVSPPQSSRATRTTKIMIRYLHDNYDRSLTIRDVAAQVHLSERHANRLFKAHMGVSVAGYLMTYRLKIAARRLLDSTLSIKAVAKSVGYPDIRYFTTLFHKHMGVTPAAYRKVGGTHFL